MCVRDSRCIYLSERKVANRRVTQQLLKFSWVERMDDNKSRSTRDTRPMARLLTFSASFNRRGRPLLRYYISGSGKLSTSADYRLVPPYFFSENWYLCWCNFETISGKYLVSPSRLALAFALAPAGIKQV